ncbi:MAG: hypothetical protein PHI90_08230, partial [Clostridia bacterium]|nr:hypothetical protein [Clostridia bacterium]
MWFKKKNTVRFSIVLILMLLTTMIVTLGIALADIETSTEWRNVEEDGKVSSTGRLNVEGGG